MSDLPPCPKCNSSYTYQDREFFVCPECAHEWSGQTDSASAESKEKVYKDAHGNVLQNGDFISVLKDLKVKGSSSVVKIGTKVRIIRLVEGDHDIDCNIKGIGAMQLKTQFVKKVLD